MTLGKCWFIRLMVGVCICCQELRLCCYLLLRWLTWFSVSSLGILFWVMLKHTIWRTRMYVLGMRKNGGFRFGNYVDVVLASNRMIDWILVCLGAISFFQVGSCLMINEMLWQNNKMLWLLPFSKLHRLQSLQVTINSW